MKIALLGYGRMGKSIEKIAKDRGHEIVAKIDKNNPLDSLNNADVAINFSIPNAALANITNALNVGIPVVCGTTGWLDHKKEVDALCNKLEGAFLYASNFSLGVNLFFELNKKLASYMRSFPEYKVEIEEIHHTQKLDAPSGTAITLAEGVIDNSEHKQWHLDGEAKEGFPIKALRKNDVPGTHTVSYHSEVDSIDITHTAHSRTGFALGAVVAAEWILGKKGVFGMRDVLGL
jgi:4-hydroxy-tetrahydrodipicolinate reductase